MSARLMNEGLLLIFVYRDNTYDYMLVLLFCQYAYTYSIRYGHDCCT